MEQIKIVVSVDLVEDLFRNSRKCREFAVCTTTILELKQCVETYLSKRLQCGHSISIQDAFKNAINDIVVFEDDWQLD